MKPHTEIIGTQNQLEDVAKCLLSTFPKNRVFGFWGEMGAGKTTLIKAICKVLMIQNIPSSPTFAIVNEYWTERNVPVYHFDFYRIDYPEEAIAIGLFEYLESGSYCFMEWTEKVESILPEDYVRIDIERIDNETRKFIFS